MPMLRQMSMGDVIMIPYYFHKAAHSAASVLKRDFGASFTVNRIGSDNIIIERVL